MGDITMNVSTRSIQPSAEFNESSLVARAMDGDGDAFGDLIRDLVPRMLRLAQHIVKDRSDAEDVLQTALWKSFQHLRDYRREAAFSAWLARITSNEAYMLLKKRRAEQTSLMDAARAAKGCTARFLRAPEQTPEQICIRAEMRRILGCRVRKINKTYAGILQLRANDELSCREIAELQGLPMSTVKTRLHRGRRLILKAWNS